MVERSVSHEKSRDTKPKLLRGARIVLASFILPLPILAACAPPPNTSIPEPISIATPIASEADVAKAKIEFTQGFNATEAIIVQTDKGFSALAENLKGKLDAYSLADQQALLAPIQIYDVNRTNPTRDYYTLLLQDLNTRGKAALETPFSMKPANPLYFFMGEQPGGGMFVGSFSPISRSLNLSPEFNGDDLYDVLIAYHETEHARQDAERRAKFISAGLWDKYIYLVYPDNGFIVGKDEQEAYFKESIIFDALTGGKLGKDIAAGTVDLDWYMKFLNARPQQRMLVNSEIEFARQAFTSGSNLHHFTPGYAKAINSQYKGRVVVDVTSNNEIILVK